MTYRIKIINGSLLSMKVCTSKHISCLVLSEKPSGQKCQKLIHRMLYPKASAYVRCKNDDKWIKILDLKWALITQPYPEPSINEELPFCPAP
jgi:hypothetical protein